MKKKQVNNELKDKLQSIFYPNNNQAPGTLKYQSSLEANPATFIEGRHNNPPFSPKSIDQRKNSSRNEDQYNLKKTYKNAQRAKVKATGDRSLQQ
jgi:hypothetical protein